MDSYEEEVVISPEAELFHNAVREHVISFLLFISLVVLSHLAVSWCKRRPDQEELWTDQEDQTVYRVTLGICTFVLAVSMSAMLLLPISIVSNEVLLAYPKSYYVQWLNSSLIQSLWNYVSMFSNLSFFILMPFAYLFSESQGFAGSRRGIIPRLQETILTFLLVAISVLGVVFVATSLVYSGPRRAFLDLWNFYLPLLYSSVSFLGILLLLVCTPLGFVHIFGALTYGILNGPSPAVLRDVRYSEQLSVLDFEALSLRRWKTHREGRVTNEGGSGRLLNGWHFREMSEDELNSALTATMTQREELVRRRKRSCCRHLLLPLLLLLTLAITALLVLYVARNVLELLFSRSGLRNAESHLALGLKSLSMFGWIGAIIQVVLNLYSLTASLLGLYHIPVMRQHQPQVHGTSLFQLQLNCLCLLLLSSAIPVQSRILGMTTFNLLAAFGRLDWLGNFGLVIVYNLVFVGVTALVVLRHCTAKLRRELVARLKAGWRHLRGSGSSGDPDVSVSFKSD